MDQSGSQTKRKRDATTGSTVKVHLLDWEKEFQKLFLDDPYEKGIIYASGDNVKDFIQRLLTTQRQEILGEILKHNKDDMTGLYDYDGIAQDVIDLIQK